MSHALVARVIGSKPRLFFFTSGTSGRCRLVEGHLASVLQAGRNHQAFDVTRIDIDQRPDVADRFRIGAVPTFLVVQNRRVSGRLDDVRNVLQLRAFLKHWLNT